MAETLALASSASAFIPLAHIAADLFADGVPLAPQESARVLASRSLASNSSTSSTRGASRPGISFDILLYKVGVGSNQFDIQHSNYLPFGFIGQMTAWRLCLGSSGTKRTLPSHAHCMGRKNPALPPKLPEVHQPRGHSFCAVTGAPSGCSPAAPKVDQAPFPPVCTCHPALCKVWEPFAFFLAVSIRVFERFSLLYPSLTGFTTLNSKLQFFSG